MKRTTLVVGITGLTILGLSQALVPAYAQSRGEAYFNARIQEMSTWSDCFGGSCVRNFLLDDRGEIRRPSPSAVAGLIFARGHLNRVGAAYGVDPRAIACSILADYTVTPYDADANTKDRNALANPGAPVVAARIRGFVLQVEPALAAEKYVAGIQKRSARNAVQIRHELQNRLGTIRITAAILREAQDDYKRNGIDISDRPEILATLYNLGIRVSRPDPESPDAMILETRGARTAERMRTDPSAIPQSNFFGLFCERYESLLTQIVGDTDPAIVMSQVLPARAQMQRQTGQVAPGVRGWSERVLKRVRGIWDSHSASRGAAADRATEDDVRAAR